MNIFIKKLFKFIFIKFTKIYLNVVIVKMAIVRYHQSTLFHSEHILNLFEHLKILLCFILKIIKLQLNKNIVLCNLSSLTLPEMSPEDLGRSYGGWEWEQLFSFSQHLIAN